MSVNRLPVKGRLSRHGSEGRMSARRKTSLRPDRAIMLSKKVSAGMRYVTLSSEEEAITMPYKEPVSGHTTQAPESPETGKQAAHVVLE
jgi:hypothetical protein